MSRWTAVLVLIGLLVVGVAYDRVDFAPEPVDEVVPPARVSPAVAPEGALSAVWYCPVGSGSADGIGQHTLTVTNMADEAAVANVNLLTDTGAGPALRLDLDARSSEVLNLADLDTSPLLGAVVEIIGGQGAVGHSVATAVGVARGACGTETSDRWYFADGVTTRDSREYLVLLNPFSQDVVFNAEFQTSSRARRPDDLQAAVVPGRSVRLVDVGEYVSREPNVATVLTTVQGRLSVERLQVFDGSLGPVGAALTGGVNEPALEWHFPAGRVHDGGDHRLTLFNPGITTAEIDVQLDLADPADRASYGLVPIEVTVSAGRLATVDLKEEIERTGLPMPAEVGITVRSTNGMGVVAERWQVTPGIDTSLIGAGGTNASIGFGRGGAGLPMRFQDGEDVESPEDTVPGPVDTPSAESLIQLTATQGVAISRGTATLATEWVVPLAAIGEPGQTVVVATSPEGSLISVQLVVAGELLPPIRGMAMADGRVQIPIEGPITEAPLLLRSDTPFAAEVQFVGADGRIEVFPAVPILEKAE